MSDPQKTVFISYRRSTSKHLARAIFMDLRANGYDAFLDVNTIDSGEFDRIILNQIAARAHFVLLLTPGALDRCQDENDWLRREIEEAIRLQRNFVPIIEEGFDLEKETEYLPEEWREQFRKFNGPRLFHDYFDACLDTLRTRFLKVPEYEVKTTAPPVTEQRSVEKRIEEVAAQPAPSQQELSAEQYFNSGYSHQQKGELGEAIADYTEAIRLKPDFVEAYMNRGAALYRTGDLDGAIKDCNQAIRVKSNYYNAYNNRGLAHHAQGNSVDAIRDFTRAIYFKPDYSEAYLNRGVARSGMGDLNGTLADFTEAIHLRPNFGQAYYRRGSTYLREHNFTAALSDFSEVIRLTPNEFAYDARGETYFAQGRYEQAHQDFVKALDLEPGFSFALGGMAVTRHMMGQVEAALETWRQLMAIDENYRDPEWTGKELNWPEAMVEEARKLCAKL